MLLRFNFRFNFCSAFSIFNTLFIHSVILNSTLKRYHNINLKKSVSVSDMVVQWNNACLVSKRSRVRVSECAPKILLDIIWYTSTDFNTSEWIRSRRAVVPSCVTEIRWVSKFFFSEKLKNWCIVSRNGDIRYKKFFLIFQNFLCPFRVNSNILEICLKSVHFIMLKDGRKL